MVDGLQVERLGPMHQAGSDSLLTAKSFFTFVERFMGGDNWDEKRLVSAGAEVLVIFMCICVYADYCYFCSCWYS